MRNLERMTVWVDKNLCQGCEACVAVCPVEAIRIVDGKAWVDEATCTGCGACIAVCPADAIQPVETTTGELIPEPIHREPTVRRPSPLAETTGAALVTVGAGLIVKAASGLARAIGRWLMRRPAVSLPTFRDRGTPGARRPSRQDARSAETGGREGGRRRRRRRRGG